MEWFEELAKKVADNDPAYLINNAKKIPWKWDVKTNSPVFSQSLLDYGDENIDPFSFIYTVASKATTIENTKRVFGAISETFELTSELNFDSGDNFVFPTPMPFALLFHGGEGTFQPELLWKFFRLVVGNQDSIDDGLFQELLSIPKVATPKITQAMFLVSPRRFFPLDNKVLDGNLALFSNLQESLDDSWTKYNNWLDELREMFPKCELYEINFLIFLLSINQISMQRSTFFQVSTNVYNDGRDFWEDFRDNNVVYVGGQGRRPYKLTEPNPGDIFLVRKGQREAKGMGIVYKNDYAGEFQSEHRVHVIWINKNQSRTREQMPQFGFSKTAKVKETFEKLPEYKLSFELLDRLTPEGPSPDPSPAHPLNQILFGPPGTGKTWNAEKRAVSIVEGSPDQESGTGFRERYEELVFDFESGSGQIAFITFHQNFAYEDFIEGIRPALHGSDQVKYEVRQGIFKQICSVAREHPDQRYVLIIDEINRGNIAKILGELITLVEESRRLGNNAETRATLPYSGELFGVPKNLYIIGTMNTADRSIQLLDTALRRRFQFDELMPDCEHSGISRDCDGVDCSKMLQSINEKITVLLDREHQIGHTYLLGVNTVRELAETFKHRIFPLLQEYFFDDWSKIRTVLGNNGFVTKKSVEVLNERAYQDDDSGDVYERTPFDDDVWENLEEYRKIYNT